MRGRVCIALILQDALQDEVSRVGLAAFIAQYSEVLGDIEATPSAAPVLAITNGSIDVDAAFPGPSNP